MVYCDDMDEIYLVLNLGFIILGYKGLRAVYGFVLGGLFALFYAVLSDPEVMTWLLVFTGGVLWLVILLFGAILGGVFTLIGGALHKILS